MRGLIIIILSFLLFSCNPFISKELRKKNRCNRKLERVVNKCPELLKPDTTIINFDTTVITNEVKIDTFVSLNFDTLKIVKDKFRLKLIKSVDTLIIDGGCLADTIFIDKIIKIPVEKITSIKLTPLEQAQNLISSIWIWLLLFLFAYFTYKLFIKI